MLSALVVLTFREHRIARHADPIDAAQGKSFEKMANAKIALNMNESLQIRSSAQRQFVPNESDLIKMENVETVLSTKDNKKMVKYVDLILVLADNDF